MRARGLIVFLALCTGCGSADDRTAHSQRKMTVRTGDGACKVVEPEAFWKSERTAAPMKVKVLDRQSGKETFVGPAELRTSVHRGSRYIVLPAD